APSALADGKRSGRPRTTPALTDATLRQLLTSDPCQFGYDANTWTVPLLATHLHTRRCDQCPHTAAPDSRCPLPLEASALRLQRTGGAFLLALRKAYRRAGTIWLLADRASGHTAAATLALAKELRIEFVWLPKQWPELNAMDQLWKELKRDVAANRQAASIDNLAERASQWVLNLTPAQARRKSGMASSKFWLRSLSQHIWQPT